MPDINFGENAPRLLPASEERRDRQLCGSPEGGRTLPGPLVRDDGTPLSLREAIEVYLKLNYSNTQNDEHTSRYERARYEKYPRILEGERQLRERYDGLTTVMLVRRISPFDDDGDLLRPLAIDEMLNSEGIRRAVRRALNYHLNGWQFEWTALVTPEQTLGTPQEIQYLWVDDPDDALSIRHVEPALRKHVEMCPNTSWSMHEYSQSGTSGVLQVRNDPALATAVPERFADHPPTTGALYTASQLPDLVLRDVFDPGAPDPPPALVEGAVTGYASPRRWVRFSSGFPSLNNG